MRALRSSSFLPIIVESITTSVIHKAMPADATDAAASPANMSTSDCSTGLSAARSNASRQSVNDDPAPISSRKRVK